MSRVRTAFRGRISASNRCCRSGIGNHRSPSRPPNGWIRPVRNIVVRFRHDCSLNEFSLVIEFFSGHRSRHKYPPPLRTIRSHKTAQRAYVLLRVRSNSELPCRWSASVCWSWLCKTSIRNAPTNKTQHPTKPSLSERVGAASSKSLLNIFFILTSTNIRTV